MAVRNSKEKKDLDFDTYSKNHGLSVADPEEHQKGFDSVAKSIDEDAEARKYQQSQRSNNSKTKEYCEQENLKLKQIKRVQKQQEKREKEIERMKMDQQPPVD